ncbi:MAG TPA: GH116 family glycosyl-hydrolase [Chthonomonadaceae bacterium]|nr:GH116 family glycosyl-hydrolase [Chthonomonadaceae bacterium]
MRTFTGESLREIAFPLGGIGTGTVSLGGRGQLRDWEIFNHPGKGKGLPYTFFALYAEAEGSPGVARVLERRLMPPYSAGFGLPTSSVSGLPRLKEATFHGEYPLARIDFHDDALPVQVSLEAYNPFIPMNEKDSGIPVALFLWTLTNTSGKPVRATVACNLLNAVGYNGREGLGNRHHPMLGQNKNEWREEDAYRGLFLSSARYDPESPQYGTLALATWAPDTTVKLRWERAGWWDDAQNFWDEFTQGRGIFPPRVEPTPSPDGQTDVGALGLPVTLAPGESVTLPFVLAWHFPNLTNTWNREETVKGKRLGNWYATQWTDAWDVAQYVIAHRERLEAETRAYHQALYTSTLPECVIDAAGANASILRTTTVLRTEDGRMNGFEGCGDNDGCCPMNCTHVWNYSWTVAALFPSLERSVRQTDFAHNTRPDGNMAFRTLLPLIGELWAHPAAADGQMGTVMKAYREWLQSGDKAFLKSLWPGIVKAVEYAWQPGSWDADKDGVMEGEQHNTYDIEFYGPNTMCGLFYLGALRAAEEMAKVLGETAKAEEYRAVFESGKQKYSELLWNGEFFTQIVNTDLWLSRRPAMSPATHPDTMLKDTEPRYQYGPGCITDMLLGQWFAHNIGLGYLLPEKQVKQAIAAIYKHNFKPDLSQHETVQRVYALNDEAGLLLCSWPNGGRPKYPFPYADEVWTGIEYQVAAHLIYEGFIEEGLAIVKGVRDRHDGAKRNPWNEFECGHHYARAMSSWSLLLALSGYQYDADRQHLAFAPKVNADDFRCFFSAGNAWGVFTQEQTGGGYNATFRILWGELTLEAISLPSIPKTGLFVDAAQEPLAVQVSGEQGIHFDAPLTLSAGQTLEVHT